MLVICIFYVQVLERSQNEGKTNGCSKTLVVIGDGDVGSQIKELFDKKNREFSGNYGSPVKVLVFRTTTTMERNGTFFISGFVCDFWTRGILREF